MLGHPHTNSSLITQVLVNSSVELIEMLPNINKTGEHYTQIPIAYPVCTNNMNNSSYTLNMALQHSGMTDANVSVMDDYTTTSYLNP